MNTESLNALLPPYARALHMEIYDISGDVPVIAMPFDARVTGRPGFLHGGAISGLLEMAAVAAIHMALRRDNNDVPIKQVNVTIDFMRSAGPRTTYAKGTITRLGRTMANVEAHAWQSDPEKTIAKAYMHYLLKSI